jgi:hypothetical protein
MTKPTDEQTITDELATSQDWMMMARRQTRPKSAAREPKRV